MDDDSTLEGEAVFGVQPQQPARTAVFAVVGVSDEEAALRTGVRAGTVRELLQKPRVGRIGTPTMGDQIVCKNPAIA